MVLEKLLNKLLLILKNNGYISGGMEMPTERLYDEIKNTKKQFTSNDQNYMGIGGTEVGQPFDYLQYDNAETNATKKLLLKVDIQYLKVINIIIVKKHIMLKLRKMNLIIIIIDKLIMIAMNL